MSDVDIRLGVVGAGTMGAGIAALAARASIPTTLYDVDPSPLGRGLERIERSHRRIAEKRGLGDDIAAEWAQRLTTTTALADLGPCTVILEAVPEDGALKGRVLADLAAASDATLASNTSSIPISELADRSGAPERLLGLHFFNPPERMRLVELVRTGRAGDEHAARARGLGEALGKRVIAVSDSPGFLVNRCARPYYLEALRIVEDGLASVADVDRACVQDGGFPLGPFELMDLIGLDVSLAVTRSMYEQSDGEPRWRPTPLQRAMVAAGRLGRKAGGGFYAPGRSWREQRAVDAGIARALLERIVAQLVNEAAFAAAEGVASPEAIDEAMVVGLNHPKGPGEWARSLGVGHVVAVLDALWEREHDPRYRVAPSLRRAVDEHEPR